MLVYSLRAWSFLEGREGTERGVEGSQSQCVCSQEVQGGERLCSVSLYAVWNHIPHYLQLRSLYLSSETFLTDIPEVCLVGNLRSCQLDSISHPQDLSFTSPDNTHQMSLCQESVLVSGVKLQTFLIRCQAAWYLASGGPSIMSLIITYLNNCRSIVLAVKIVLTFNNLKLTGNYIDFSQSWLKFCVDLLCIHAETDLDLAHTTASLGRFPAKSSTSHPRGSPGFFFQQPCSS